MIESDENRSRYAPPRLPSPLPEQSNAPSHHFTPCLQLTFNPPPRRDKGLVCGWDPTCDIVLPNKHGISFHHGAFTFDDHNRLVYDDLGSPEGSAVTYSNQGRGWRRTFRWILDTHSVPGSKSPVVLHLTPFLCFHVVVCRDDPTSPLYIENVRRFRQGTANVESLFDEVDLDRLPTEPGSGVHSPLGSGPIELRTKLGEGSFGTVWHVWDVTTGEQHALKEPSAKAISRRRVDVDRWREEARILGRMQHVK